MIHYLALPLFFPCTAGRTSFLDNQPVLYAAMSIPSRSSSVTANIGENRLLISLHGVVSKKDVDSLYTDIRFCVSDLKPGFAVITDMTGCRFGHLSGIPVFKKITDFLIYKEVGPIVRVVGKARVIFRQFERLSPKTDGYVTHYVSNMDEAEKVIAEYQNSRTAA